MSIFISVIDEHRKKCGLTWTALAAKIGISKAFISRIKKGDYLPSIEQLPTWAESLKLKGQAKLDFISLGELAHAPQVVQKRFNDMQSHLDTLQRMDLIQEGSSQEALNYTRDPLHSYDQRRSEERNAESTEEYRPSQASPITQPIVGTVIASDGCDNVQDDTDRVRRLELAMSHVDMNGAGLASCIGITPQAFGQLKTGRIKAELRWRQISEVLQVDFHWLYNGDGEPPAWANVAENSPEMTEPPYDTPNFDEFRDGETEAITAALVKIQEALSLVAQFQAEQSGAIALLSKQVEERAAETTAQLRAVTDRWDAAFAGDKPLLTAQS